MKAKYIPERGDIVWIDFNPTRGHEQAHKRPALVLSLKLYNEKRGLILACPVTSKTKNYPFEVEVKAGKVRGVILADQIRTLDWQVRRVAFIERVDSVALARVRETIIRLLTEE